MATELANTLTVLFTDVEGSTELRTRRGEELGMEVLRAHEELVRGALGRYEGREEKFLGDGFMASFSSARQALGCAVAIQRGVERHNREHADRGLELRIGLPLRAIADFDEGWMYLRRGLPGDADRARPLLDAATQQFTAIGMSGWLRRAQALRDQMK